MATVQEFITAKLSRFNIELSETEIEGVLTDQGLSGSDIYSQAVSIQIKKAIVSVIPELLLVPDVTEGGYAVKWDRAGVKAYYSLLCKELGIPDAFASPKPTVTDMSSRW